MGRGNRTSGLITPYRPLASEAIARRAARESLGVSEATCVLVSQIGNPIDDPQVVDLRVAIERGQPIESVTASLREVVETELHRFPEFQADLLKGLVPVY